MHDLVIRGGRVVDGTGSAARTADVAVSNGIITEVGRVDGPARHTVDADGLMVTPGFVDIHTHYDGQATWDPVMTPSSWHGVTTAVMGNCGVGFAPVDPTRRDWLVGLMEGVEDIPGTALHEGIKWAWETFPEYLNALETLPRVMDVGTHVPHGAVRAYVMGERGARNEPATPDDIAAMAAIVKEGVRAGALGFSMSRTIVHRAVDGEPVPGTFAAVDEVLGIASVLGELGAGLVELAPAGVVGEDLLAPEREMAWMREVAGSTGRPVTFVLVQHDSAPGMWKDLLDECTRLRGAGVPLYPQIHTRSPALLVNLATRLNPFLACPSWAALAGLPVPEVVSRLTADSALRMRLVAEADAGRDALAGSMVRFDRMYALGDPPDYEPPASASVAAEAARRGVSEYEVALEWMMRRNGAEMLEVPILNWADGNHDVVHEMLLNDTTVLGLGDGGAHTASIVDSATPTHMLAYWARDRRRGLVPFETCVRKMTSETAALYGLGDRGVLAPGKRADINLIDADGVQLLAPEVWFDLPSGAPRLVQGARGYVGTWVAGEQTFHHGEPTGARPGRLVRGAR